MQHSKFQYGFAAISTNFNLEPVLEDYFAEYPKSEYESYDVVFRTENEHVEGAYSYLVVFKLNRSTRESSVKFHEFLKSHCIRNNLVATMDPVSHVFPQLGGRKHTFGTLQK